MRSGRLRKERGWRGGDKRVHPRKRRVTEIGLSLQTVRPGHDRSSIGCSITSAFASLCSYGLLRGVENMHGFAERGRSENAWGGKGCACENARARAQTKEHAAFHPTRRDAARRRPTPAGCGTGADTSSIDAQCLRRRRLNSRVPPGSPAFRKK